MTSYTVLYQELGGRTHDRSVADRLAMLAAQIGVAGLAAELAAATLGAPTLGRGLRSRLAIEIRRLTWPGCVR